MISTFEKNDEQIYLNCIYAYAERIAAIKQSILKSSVLRL